MSPQQFIFGKHLEFILSKKFCFMASKFVTSFFKVVLQILPKRQESSSRFQQINFPRLQFDSSHQQLVCLNGT